MLDGVHILFVDDREEDADLYATLLSIRGARVTVALAASDALELSGRERFDVVVSDISLPDRTGYELLRALRERGVRAPAIALTGWSGDRDRAEAFEAGFDEHCAKPCPPSELAGVIARVVSRSKVSEV
jgi:two-component system CheB/CheR fusion protein